MQMLIMLYHLVGLFISFRCQPHVPSTRDNTVPAQARHISASLRVPFELVRDQDAQKRRTCQFESLVLPSKASTTSVSEGYTEDSAESWLLNNSKRHPRNDPQQGLYTPQSFALIMQGTAT